MEQGGNTGLRRIQAGTIFDLLTIQDNGNVGIGTTAPQAALEVVGGVRASDGAAITSGASCSPEGMSAYDLTNHQPVYCNQSGIWTDVNASSAFLNRTWHNVMGQRTANTAYRNNYSYPIDVAMGGGSTNPPICVEDLIVNGTTIEHWGAGDSSLRRRLYGLWNGATRCDLRVQNRRWIVHLLVGTLLGRLAIRL